MNELEKLRKENKRLKVLLKNAVELLKKTQTFLQPPEKLRVRKSTKETKKPTKK
jgi:hypothetical protein